MKISWIDDLTQKICTPEQPGAFECELKITPWDGSTVRRLTLTLKPGEAPRSLRIYYSLPHIAGGRTRYWNSSFTEPEGYVDTKVAFFQEKLKEEWDETTMPRVWEGNLFFRFRGLSHAAEFIPGAESGWYAGLLPENPNGVMWYSYQKDDFIFADTYRYIDQENPVVSELLYFENCADWRPCFGWFYNHYTEYFQPVNKKMMETEGTFCITNPLSSDATLDDAAAHGVCFTELHNHYPAYGKFVPEEKEWESVVLHDYPDLPFPKEKISPEKINQFIKKLHDRNIKVLYYFQITGDCFQPFAEENFPEDIAINQSGEKIGFWKECWVMNAAPGSRYAKHIDKMLEELFVRHPDIDGIFMDQIGYQYEDIAHNDGMSGYKNKRISNLRESYYPVIEKAARMLHSRGKILWFNGAFNTKVQRFADGIMAEGAYGASEITRYFCIDKPLLVHRYPDEPVLASKVIAYALRSGAKFISIGGSSSKVDAILSKEAEAIYNEGNKLLELLKGKKWCFLSRPVELPDGAAGNIYYGQEPGTFIITVATMDNLPPEVKAQQLTLQLNLPGEFSGFCRTFGKADVPVKIENNKIAIEHRGMSVIVLKTRS